MAPREDSHEAYIRGQFDSSRRTFALYPNWDIRDKTVLDIGCGTGGRTAYLAATGARRAVGIDINSAEIETAREVCGRLYPEAAGRLEFLASSEDGRLDIGGFDVVVFVDAMEHVVSPARALRLAYDYTKPGGRCYFSTQGWYHYRGTHTDLIPFVNLLFSDETILNVIRWDVCRSDYRPSRFDSSPPVERWRGLYDLRDRPGEYLNKITIRGVKRLLHYGPFKESRLTVVPFSRPAWLAPIARIMVRVPVVQECLHSGVVAECLR